MSNNNTPPDVYVQNATYDESGRVKGVTLGAGTLTRSYSYYPWATAEDGGRLDVLETQRQGVDLQNWKYSYDKNGNIVKLDDFVHGEEQRYTYDGLGRLTGTVIAGPVPSSETFKYNDALGRMSAKNGQSFTYSTSHPHAPTALGSNTYAYDSNGNQTTRTLSGVTYTLSYNGDNRMSAVVRNTPPTQTWNYLYDGDGVLMKVEGITTDRYLVSRNYQRSVTGGVATELKYYDLGGQVLAMRTNGVLSYILSDHLGSTSLTTDGNGVQTSETRYTAFGEIRVTSGTVPTEYKYTGQLSIEVGLYSYVSRNYDPYLSHFSQADTLVPDAGSAMGYDRYSYVGWNPIVYIDPTGNFRLPPTPDECGPDGIRCDQPRKDKESPVFFRPDYFNPPLDKPSISGWDYEDDNGTEGGHKAVDLLGQLPNIYSSGWGIVVINDSCSIDPCIEIHDINSPNTNYGYGNLLIIEYPPYSLPETIQSELNLKPGQSLYFLYAHMEKPGTKEVGDFVFPREKVGKVGDTGNSWGSHLHFVIKVGSWGALRDVGYPQRVWFFLNEINPHDVLHINPKNTP